jgi:DNA-binding MarR family transcriptional regulator
MADEPLSREESHLWQCWRLASEAVMARVTRDISAGTGLSGPDYAVLARLHHLGRGEMRQQDLAGSMRWDKSRLSHHLTRMEGRALILRRLGPGKGVTVVLSAAGSRQLAAATPVHAQAVRLHLVSRLSTAQRKALLALSQLLHDVAPVEAWPPNDPPRPVPRLSKGADRASVRPPPART